MNPQSVIRLKRDGHALSDTEISAFVSGAVSGDWSRGQVGAMLMALFQQGLSFDETRYLLEAMVNSGDILDMDGMGRPIVDKHSTGGVGDKVSLVLAPLAAACGLAVPMLSGRRLGHTGGTLDKLESIPGFKVTLTAREIRRQVQSIGCVISGQTHSVAPADKLLYAMRDETSTVENASLVASSILSKKLAEGLDALLLDVKFGRGAFFQEREMAEEVARLMVKLGNAAGCRTGAWLTRMDTPLGRAVGNAVEVEESIQILKGEGPDDVADFICELVAGMMVLGGLEQSHEGALEKSRAALRNGSALDHFRKMVQAQGGDVSVIDNPSLLPKAKHVVEVQYEESKPVWVKDVDALAIARIFLETGAGRHTAQSTVDHADGVSGLVAVGERVEPGNILGRLHYSASKPADECIERFRDAITFSPAPVEVLSRIYKKIM